MALAKTKRLGEFLKEQQEPFKLELYLLERGHSTNGESGKSLERWAINKKREPLFPFSKVLTTLHKKLVFHNHSCIVIRDSDIIHEQVNVSVPNDAESTDQTTVETDISVPNKAESTDQTIEDTDRFSVSTATNSTVYLSCSDIDEDGTSWSPHKDKALFSPNTSQASNMGVLQSQQATNNEKHNQRCLEGSPVPESRTISVTHGTMNQDVSGMEERMSNCCVFVPKRISDDSLLSVALWSSLIQSVKREKCGKELGELLGANPNVCHVLKSKTLLHKAKQLLFYCVREITINLSRKDCREQGFKQLIRGPDEPGKIKQQRTRALGQVAGNDTNLINLLTSDYLDSMDEWSEFKPQGRHICVEVADAVLERVTNEIVAEMIDVL
ncbi:hypothetical protein E2542_SST03717 [Spatholobus suberectus]|nr:hypothetical protein E2542_SST03717 [Spatholobus suberectus]